jgi:sulfur relay (sulfurtransferase) DsrF/TusC family protein
VTAAPKKTVLIVLRHSPYGSGLAKAALDAALASAAFDQAVDPQAAARYNMDLSKAPLHTRQLDNHEIHQLMVGYDHLLGF